MSKVVTVGATALFACILCAIPSRFACCPRETWRCPSTAPQRRLVVPSLQEALRALIAGYIGARIGAGTTGPAHTTVHIAMGMERTSRATWVRVSAVQPLSKLPATLFWVWQQAMVAVLIARSA